MQLLNRFGTLCIPTFISYKQNVNLTYIIMYTVVILFVFNREVMVS